MKTLAGSALAGAALALSAPVIAHAAPATPMSNQCEEIKGQALEAQDDYDAVRKQYEAGDKSLRKQVEEAEQNANSLASEAQRVCGDTVMNPEHPHGAMHTGAGTTSAASTPQIATGVGVIAAVGAGVLVVNRRRRSGQV